MHILRLSYFSFHWAIRFYFISLEIQKNTIKNWLLFGDG